MTLRCPGEHPVWREMLMHLPVMMMSTSTSRGCLCPGSCLHRQSRRHHLHLATIARCRWLTGKRMHERCKLLTQRHLFAQTAPGWRSTRKRKNPDKYGFPEAEQHAEVFEAVQTTCRRP
jgi:hypothetical protein